VRAGDGGNGVVHFRREKFKPKGGPDGGDGGNGGDVVLEVASNTDNLTHLFFNSKIIGQSGEHGRGREQKGKAGKDKVVKVPPGTLIFAAPEDGVRVERPEEELELVADLTTDGERFVIAKGGASGRGNANYKSPTNRAPEDHTLGTPGAEGHFYMELRQIADAGLVGFPNAGKSTLLGALSEAKPRVASYPFTTLQPSVGVLEFKGFSRGTVADIPGLIEGAHENVGLGHDFLRHIMRCKLLLFMVDTPGSEERDPIEDLQKLRTEIKLYNEELASRDWLIIANKMDLEDAEERLGYIRSRFPKVEVIPVSATTGDGVAELKRRLGELIGHRPE